MNVKVTRKDYKVKEIEEVKGIRITGSAGIVLADIEIGTDGTLKIWTEKGIVLTPIAANMITISYTKY